MPYSIIYFILQVNIVGVISFEDAFDTFISRPFPYSNGDILICPLWTDLWYNRGTLYQNSALDINTKIRITQLIQGSLGYNFIPTGVFIATWDDVAYFTDISNVRCLAIYRLVVTTLAKIKWSIETSMATIARY